MPDSQDEASRQDKRTWLSAVVFLDVVEYTKGSVERQILIKDHMISVVGKSVEGVEESDRVIVDSGDGAAVCFLGDPEDSLFCAVKLRDGFDSLSGRSDIMYEVRIGINLGPVKVVRDVNNRPNVLGDGINVAQRIMSFANRGQILVSRSFYEVISCLSQEYDNLFHYQGKNFDKHGREHSIYEFDIPENAAAVASGEHTSLDLEFGDVPAATERSRVAANPTATATPVEKYHEWDPAVLRAAQEGLTQYIGPLAKILVRKIARTTNDIEQLYEQLGDTLEDPRQRVAFVETLRARLAMIDSADLKTITSESRPEGSVEWDSRELKRIEKHLAEHLGPLAGVLVKKAAANTTDIRELYDTLALNLADENARRAFLKTMP
ncbi:MAG: adenylate/guanylate cyclase domain-containing protein [Gammaproteobacteria bacterium]|jgi:class 3 adenylate cyclase